VDILLESELQTILYDVQKARHTVAKLSEPVMQGKEISGAFTYFDGGMSLLKI
jgi:hypothetical protein